jgi:cytochrome c oxidase subunit III
MAHANEHALDPAHISTATGLDNRKLAFWTFIGSECLLFGALIGTYLAYKGKSLTGPYPHDIVIDGIAHDGILNIPLTSFSTFILLMSSVSMVLALNYTQRGMRREQVIWLLATAGMGAIFLGIQVYEFWDFYNKGLGLGTNIFGSTFYTLTGFHGAHVLVGIIYMCTLAWRGNKGLMGPEKTVTVEIAGLYWHFVDVIWIVIFPLVYLIR